MRIGEQELFNTSEITNFIAKFQDRMDAIQNRIDSLTAELEKLDPQIKEAIEEDIMEGTPTSRKKLQNLNAKKVNIHNQIAEEQESGMDIYGIMQKRLGEIVPAVSKQCRTDMAVYYLAEKELFRQLCELREQQEELLLLVNALRNQVIHETFPIKDVCETYPELKRHSIDLSNQSFHQNPFFPNRSCPQYGSPLLNLTQISNAQNVIDRSRAEANAMCDEEQRKELKRDKKDVNLQAFLDSIADIINKKDNE